MNYPAKMTKLNPYGNELERYQNNFSLQQYPTIFPRDSCNQKRLQLCQQKQQQLQQNIQKRQQVAATKNRENRTIVDQTGKVVNSEDAKQQQNDENIENNKDTKTSQQATEAWVKNHFKIIDPQTGKEAKFEVIEQHDETIENNKDTKANTSEVSVELGTDVTSAKSTNSSKENTKPKVDEQNAKKSAPQNSSLVKHPTVQTDNSAQIASNASITASRQTNCGVFDAQGIDEDDESENCNKWKPLRMDLVFLDLSQDEKKTLFLLRTFTSQLNKLTSDNCSRSMDKMKNLPIDNLIRMQGVVDIIYEKAIREQMYLSLYAQICHLLKDKQIVNETGTLETFSSFLLARCMKNFDISLTENLVYERKKFEIDLIDCQKMRKLLMEECSQEETGNGERFVGNCLFIGELFKWEIVQREMIFQLIDRLFKSTGNMAVICICSILTTIGKFYEDKFGKISSTYFEKIESFCGEELPPRIRFLLQDLLELRKNSWCPRIPLDEREVVDSDNDFELIDSNEGVENFVVDASIEKIPEVEQPQQHDDVPVGLLSREIFNSVTDEFKESPLDVDVKSEANKKYTVEFLSSCRTLRQCNEPVTISSPQFADTLLKKETNDAESQTWNSDKKTAKNGPSFRTRPTKSRRIPPPPPPPVIRPRRPKSTNYRSSSEFLLIDRIDSKNKKESKDDFGRPCPSCSGDDWGCCSCNVWLNRISQNDDEWRNHLEIQAMNVERQRRIFE